MPLLQQFWRADRSLSILLISLIVVIFVLHPLGEFGLAGRVLVSAFFSCVLISGVNTVAKKKWVTGLVGTLVITTLGVRWIRVWRGSASLILPDTLFSSLLCIILGAVVLAQVLREGPITFHRIQGAIAVYLLIGLAFAYAYAFVGLRWPDAFVPTTAIAIAHEDTTAHFVYFSFVTLTTVGFGDITAANPVARALVTIEALTGQLFPSILLARLVAMELYYRQSLRSEQP